MNNLDLVILISIIILYIIFNHETVQKINKSIEKKQIILKNENNDKINLKNILNENKIFYKNFITTKIDDAELDKLNINKGNITRQTIIGEDGGSKRYNNFFIDSNISNNAINYESSHTTYVKMPYQIK